MYVVDDKRLMTMLPFEALGGVPYSPSPCPSDNGAESGEIEYEYENARIKV